MVLYIGLGHTSRCGKDTVANFIVEHLNAVGVSAKKIPFAWKLKQIARELYSWAGVESPEHYDTKEGEQDRDIKLTKLATDEFPEGPTVVELWVQIGTPAFRNVVYPHTWVDFVLKQDHGVNVVVIPDCRFANELEAIKQAGGYSFRCVRPGFPGRNTVADNQLRGDERWDATIGGHSVAELKNQARWMADDIARGTSPIRACTDSVYWSEVYHRNNKELMSA